MKDILTRLTESVGDAIAQKINKNIVNDLIYENENPKTLKDYITEKLKINKKTKLENDPKDKPKRTSSSSSGGGCGSNVRWGSSCGSSRSSWGGGCGSPRSRSGC